MSSSSSSSAVLTQSIYPNYPIEFSRVETRRHVHPLQYYGGGGGSSSGGSGAGNHTSPYMRSGAPHNVPAAATLYRGPTLSSDRINVVYAWSKTPAEDAMREMQDHREKVAIANKLRAEHLTKRQRASAALLHYRQEQEERLRNNGLTVPSRRRIVVGQGEKLSHVISRNPNLRKPHMDFMELTKKRGISRGADVRPEVAIAPPRYERKYDIDTSLVDWKYNHDLPQKTVHQKFRQASNRQYGHWDDKDWGEQTFHGLQ